MKAKTRELGWFKVRRFFQPFVSVYFFLLHDHVKSLSLNFGARLLLLLQLIGATSSLG